jgi:hypothetical protein
MASQRPIAGTGDRRQKTRIIIMKFHLIALSGLAVLAGGSFRAEACNPLANKDFGKHVAPTTLPAAMLARNNPSSRSAASIVGLWHDVHTASDGTLFLEGYDTWNQDGTENELGNLPPATGALCVGVYTRHGKKADLTTHVAWLYDMSGDYQGTLNITEENKVAADGNSYTGSFDAKFYDPSGNLFNEVTGTTAADRLVQ